MTVALPEVSVGRAIPATADQLLALWGIGIEVRLLGRKSRGWFRHWPRTTLTSWRVTSLPTQVTWEVTCDCVADRVLVDGHEATPNHTAYLLTGDTFILNLTA